MADPGRGYVHIYTGNGKGKTTAAIGLCIRALGAGFSVFFGQFLKGSRPEGRPATSELAVLNRLAESMPLTVRQWGSGQFIMGKPSPQECADAARGLQEVAPSVCPAHAPHLPLTPGGPFFFLLAHAVPATAWWDQVAALWALGPACPRLVVLDEAMVAVEVGALGSPEVVALLNSRPSHVEVVLTGRGTDPVLLARADLVTEMREVRHYFARGLPARTGIEL
ncbi:putative cobinamide adenolsyltransferase [Paratrimastix pyriformis]|uniref:Cobinamide adenolsyltransferase n=1 Tax=Paratrimastix pyriformis TaxID=342808 RepID=A0ABQ8UDG1_9EUKA|nr:putative cobinamide adenolsyltransferase [Paratrimastix pyriformis]